MATGSPNNYFVHTLLRARDWQHRPQFDEVCDWWRGRGVGSLPTESDITFQPADREHRKPQANATRGRGVCALVGMGGAGKTAIADRFLNELPVGRIANPSHNSLPPPHSVFVYSFYDDDKPENFFRHLQIWLEGTSAPDKQKSPTQLMFDIQQHQGLMILDGLEKFQESGARGGFGRLTSPSLRDLLDHIAAGHARELSVLVTSRFPLTDLRDSQPRFFHTIAVDQLELEAGIALLKKRGVRGSDVQLAPVVEHCGRHALTIDLAGGYIKEYGDSDPSTPLDLGTAEELQAEAEQEPDDDKRAVLIQSYRFTRIAQRYREAMLESDEAALALLERICLFRLGVDYETLAAIFTGPDAEKVSGNALVGLDADQLQKKLDWLVRMRILEQSESHSRYTDSVISPCQYSVHPAVRLGLLSNLDADTVHQWHDTVRAGLTAAFEKHAMGFLPPFDEQLLGGPPLTHIGFRATLDILEEIIHHALHAGHVDVAWDVYWRKIGAYERLGDRLGAYERGERICRAFVGGKSSEAVRHYCESRDANSKSCAASPYLILPVATQMVFINEWALYLLQLGQLTAGAELFELYIEWSIRHEDLENALVGYGNLCDLWMQSGRLSNFDVTAAAYLRLAESVHNSREQSVSQAFCANAHGLRGEVPVALSHFSAAIDRPDKWKQEMHPLFLPAMWQSRLYTRLGRAEEATRQTKVNYDLGRRHWGNQSNRPQCLLTLAALYVDSGYKFGAETSCDLARRWALVRDAKQVLCWSDLVQATIALSGTSHQQSSEERERADYFKAAKAAITEGLKISRECGYGLYHIDLLLERARLHLLRGEAGEALEDIKVALDTGIPANEETGQVELLAANHEECGYAWAIPAGLQLRAEALLLKAAQMLGTNRVTGVEKRGTNDEPAADAASNETGGSLRSTPATPVYALPSDTTSLIDQANQLLQEALERWHDLRDPEPTENNNFVHPKTGKEYNYKAEATFGVLTLLNRGILTRYPITIADQTHEPEGEMSPDKPRVFVSHSSPDKPFVRKLVEDLSKRTSAIWLDERELKVGDSIVQGISDGLKDTDYVIVVLSKTSVKSNWVQAELNSALMHQISDKGTAVLPVLLEDCDVPQLLRDRVYADFRYDYDKGLNALISVFEQEEKTGAELAPPAEKSLAPSSSCAATLAELRVADLRRRMTQRLDRVEVATIWFDTFEEKMDDVMVNREKVECVIELLARAKNRALLFVVFENICAERSDLANP